MQESRCREAAGPTNEDYVQVQSALIYNLNKWGCGYDAFTAALFSLPLLQLIGDGKK